MGSGMAWARISRKRGGGGGRMRERGGHLCREVPIREREDGHAPRREHARNLPGDLERLCEILDRERADHRVEAVIVVRQRGRGVEIGDAAFMERGVGIQLGLVEADAHDAREVAVVGAAT